MRTIEVHNGRTKQKSSNAVRKFKLNGQMENINLHVTNIHTTLYTIQNPDLHK